MFTADRHSAANGVCVENVTENGGKAVYHVEDAVLYGSDGICRIAEIVTKDFGGAPTEYYVLKPIRQEASTIYVPVKNEALVQKMRHVLPEEKILELIEGMPDEKVHWIENDEERKTAYREILSTGDRSGLIRMIKSLYLHEKEMKGNGKHLRAADERFFKEAERMLYDEFALVLGIEPEQVLAFIQERIQDEGQAS